MNFLKTFLHATIAAVCFTYPLCAAEPAAPASLKAMSYNIRYGTARDGVNQWENRKEFLAEAIKSANPDILGTQETLGFQRDFLAEILLGFEVLAAGRDDGQEKGEMVAIFWRKDRFEKLDGGHFWLSEMPDTPGSMSWDTSLTRMATWVRLKDKKIEGKPILWINTHFDHMGKTARVESAKLIRNRFSMSGKDCSLIVTGDFNAGEGSEPYQAMFGASGNVESPILDTLRAVHPKPGENEGTTTPFQSAPNRSARIDWVGVSRDWKVLFAEIGRPDREGRSPSDHFPVSAVLQR